MIYGWLERVIISCQTVLWFLPDPMNAPEQFEFPEKWFSDAGSVWSGMIEVGEIEGSEGDDERISLRKESAGGGFEFSYLSFDRSGRLIAVVLPGLFFQLAKSNHKAMGFWQVSDEYDVAGILIQKLGGIIPISSNDFNFD